LLYAVNKKIGLALNIKSHDAYAIVIYEREIVD